MRVFGWVLAFVAWSATARADDKADIEKMVREQLAAFDSQMALGRHAELGPFFRQVRNSPDNYKGGNESPTFHKVTAQPTFKPGAITVSVLKDTAWFHGIGTFTLKSADKKPVIETRTIRVNGVALKKDGDWTIVGELLAIAVDDKALADEAKKLHFKPPMGAATLNGDKTLARLVDGWLTNQTFGKGASSSPNLVASGSSPNEHKTGAPAIALATTWDKVKLLPVEIEAKLVSPTVGFVLADVAMVLPKGGPPAHLVLGVVVVKEKDSWRWVSLSWSPDEWFPKPDFQADSPSDPCGD